MIQKAYPNNGYLCFKQPDHNVPPFKYRTSLKLSKVNGWMTIQLANWNWLITELNCSLSKPQFGYQTIQWANCFGLFKNQTSFLFRFPLYFISSIFYLFAGCARKRTKAGTEHGPHPRPEHLLGCKTPAKALQRVRGRWLCLPSMWRRYSFYSSRSTSSGTCTVFKPRQHKHSVVVLWI